MIQPAQSLVPDGVAAPSLPVLRKLQSADRHAIEAHLLRLEAADRRMRFGGTVSHGSISAYCEQVDWPNTVILGCFVEETLRGMAELQVRKETTPATAELAVTVERPFQDQGIGTTLLCKMLAIARNRFVGRVDMICLSENRKMQHVARKFTPSLVVSQDEVVGCVRPPWPSYFSFVEEASMDGEALWHAIFEPTAQAPEISPEREGKEPP